MSRLNDIFKTHRCDKSEHGYAEIYDLAAMITTPQSIYEIGVMDGASLRSWHDAFPGASICGMDINPKTHLTLPPGVEVYQGDGTSSVLFNLNNDGTGTPLTFDWIIDDGSHTNGDIIASFNLLFKRVNPGGFYFIEDLHTQYWESWGNNHNLPPATEFIYHKIDECLNQYGKNEKLNPDDLPPFKCVLYGKSIVAIQKR